MPLAIDTETTGPDLFHGCRPFLVTACDEEGRLLYWQASRVDPFTRTPVWGRRTLARLKQTLKEYEEFVFHNADFDLRALSLLDPTLTDLVLQREVHDTVLSNHVLRSRESRKLKDLGVAYLGILDDDESLLQKIVIKARSQAKKLGWRIAEKGDPHFPLLDKEFVYCDYWLPGELYRQFPDKYPEEWQDAALTYGLRDVERTILLYLNHQDELKAEGLQAPYERERRLIPIIYHTENRGLTLHEANLQADLKRHEEEARKHERKAIRLFPGLNLDSYPQLSKVLYHDLGLPVIKHGKTGPSTDAETLETLAKTAKGKARKFLLSILTSKKHKTACRYESLYQRGSIRFPDGSLRLCASLDQTGTGTTRFSCRNPNTQNIGKGDEWEEEGKAVKDFVLRDVFGPYKGRIWYPCDYSQLQLRIFAVASQEKSLIQAFRDGWDFHRYVACRIFKTDKPTELQRRVAKNVNFGLIFGAGARKINATAGIDGAYDMFAHQFPNVASYMDRVIAQVRRKGYVTTLGGYRLQVPREKAYAGVCYIVQGTEGDIVKNAMIDCYEYLTSIQKAGYDPYIAMQIHDELLFDFPIADNDLALSRLKTIMERAATNLGIEAPVEVSVVREKWSVKEDWIHDQESTGFPVPGVTSPPVGSVVQRRKAAPRKRKRLHLHR